MMSSSSSLTATLSSYRATSYPQIDHRTVVFKSSQLEENFSGSLSRGSSKETLIAGEENYQKTYFVATIPRRPATALQTTTTAGAATPYVSPRRPLSALAQHSTTKTKIPYPLATIWTNRRNTFHSRGVHNGHNNHNCDNCRNISSGGVGDVPMRMPGNKSNLATTSLIMEPVANETSSSSSSTTMAAGVECTAETSHNNTTPANVNRTGGRFQNVRHKLALITQQKPKEPSTDATLERSLSLRKNFKYSNQKTTEGDQRRTAGITENQKGNTKNNLLTPGAHNGQQEEQIYNKKDTIDAKDHQSIKSTIKTNMDKQSSPTSTTASSSATSTTTTTPGTGTSTTDGIINGDLQQDIQKMSLNQNGIHTSSAATTPTTTPSSASSSAAAATTHTRPLTLATRQGSTTNITSSSTSSIGPGGGIPVKTPRSPRPPVYTGTHVVQHSHHQETQTSSKLSAGVGGLKPTPKTPPVTPDSPTTYLDDDLDSLYSYTTTSGRSTMSCEHPYVARNGTTFSGRKMKYVVHCSNYAGQVGADYLTPTQRAQRQIRRLKELLCAARQDLEQKDSELLRLTREVVELRLFKASLSSPDERSASSDAVTVREAELKTSQDVSPIVDMVDDGQKQHASPSRHMHHSHMGHAASASPTIMTHASQSSTSSQQHHHHSHHHHHDMQSSFADSGHFEDMTSSSVHSKDSSYAPSTHGHHSGHHHHEGACGGGGSDADHHHHHGEPSASTIEQYELQRQELIRLYEQRIEDLIRSQDAAAAEVKRSNNDRIEALLQKLAECNTRYADIVPDYEHAKERIRELEKQLEDLQRKLAEHEEKQKQMYLHMYQKGQEAERIARADQALELAHRAPQNKVSINELLHQLQSTQDELENIRAAECRNECGSNHALLTAKEAISLWVLGARKTIYRRLLEAQKNRTHVDPEVTLQFLKSAVYYFLTDKENSQGHLQAIESILEFSEAEKQVISKARSAK
ncbi:protein quick-to-court [Musca vetustissima]|uniref:protein quick-to-court n=1 Tax=Musca vetustissima TaxID=27455 RepID=UPI002AB63B76|nr:protein quick-to-court [Musca vetustissima]